MIPDLIKQFLNKLHQVEIKQFASVGGGSINDAYQYSVGNEKFFVKYNKEVKGIIEQEVVGLRAIAALDCIDTPDVVAFDIIDNYEILVLAYISRGLNSSEGWEKFGEQLAAMHERPAPYYGWYQNNFIGSLPQINDKTDSFIEFFISQRLKPQIQLAYEAEYISTPELTQFDRLFQKLPEILPDTQPSLVHGDLWSGNFMMGEGGNPYLIDPSIHYDFRETDIAFTHLFGGFDSKFYDAYNFRFPLEPKFQERIALYNIYPLLVHLNLFGSSYYGSVISSLNQYV